MPGDHCFTINSTPTVLMTIPIHGIRKRSDHSSTHPLIPGEVGSSHLKSSRCVMAERIKSAFMLFRANRCMIHVLGQGNPSSAVQHVERLARGFHEIQQQAPASPLMRRRRLKACVAEWGVAREHARELPGKRSRRRRWCHARTAE
jgi:hypothetical protein